LIENGANVNSHSGEHRNTPLHLLFSSLLELEEEDASEVGEAVSRIESCIELLLENGAKTSIPNREGATVTSLATRSKLITPRLLSKVKESQ